MLLLYLLWEQRQCTEVHVASSPGALLALRPSGKPGDEASTEVRLAIG